MIPLVPMILVAGPTAPSSIRSEVLVTEDVATATAECLLVRLQISLVRMEEIPSFQVKTAVECSSNPYCSFRIMLPETAGGVCSPFDFQW